MCLAAPWRPGPSIARRWWPPWLRRPSNAPITPQLVAAVAGHPLGGLKGVPPEARFWVAVNKVETLPDWAAVDALAAALAAQPRVTGVAALAAQTADPVRAIYEHGVRRRLA